MCFPQKKMKPPSSFPVSQNFVSDFASIPPPFDLLINPFGKHAEAAVVHDWLYAVGKGSRTDSKEKERKKADVIFYRAMRKQEVDSISSRLMYSAVRLFGIGQHFLPSVFGEPYYGRNEAWRFYNSVTNAYRSPTCIIDKPVNPYYRGVVSRQGEHSIGALVRSFNIQMGKQKATPTMMVRSPGMARQTVREVFKQFQSEVGFTVDDFSRYGMFFYEIDWWEVDFKPECLGENFLALMDFYLPKADLQKVFGSEASDDASLSPQDLRQKLDGFLNENTNNEELLSRIREDLKLLNKIAIISHDADVPETDFTLTGLLLFLLEAKEGTQSAGAGDDDQSDAPFRSFLITLKSQGVNDPDVDLFIAVFDDDVTAVEQALNEGGNPTTTKGEILRRYEDEWRNFENSDH